MKAIKNITTAIAAVFLTLPPMLTACSDWTDPSPRDFQVNEPSAEYYENLRRWKDTWKERSISWGWYGGWNGGGADMKNALCGLPDSMDLIAIWGPYMPHQITADMRRDLDKVRDIKGTKVACTNITGWLGADIIQALDDQTPGYARWDEKERLFGWPSSTSASSQWVSTDPELRAQQEEAIRKYARAMADSVNKAGYNGFDIDWEPVFGGTGCKQELSRKDNFFIFVDELGKYFGPKSGTGKLLILDGEVDNIEARFLPYFDYFIDQTYGSSTDATLNGGKISNMVKLAEDNPDIGVEPEFLVHRYLTTTNHEANRYTGGGSYSGGVSRLEGFAAWKPNIRGVQYERSGGTGAYHIEYEYMVPGMSGFYPYVRRAIQIMNPAEGSVPEPDEDEEE